MQSFLAVKDQFGGEIAIGIMAAAVLIGLAHEGFLAGRWLAVALHHS